MHIEQSAWSEAAGWLPRPPVSMNDAQLALLFGSRQLLESSTHLDTVRAAYPGAEVLGCSTAGEICGTRVSDDTLVVTAVRFDHSRVRTAVVSRRAVGSSEEAGASLARSLPHEGLVHVFVLSDGLSVNGSELVAGLSRHLPPSVTVTGGLSGDGARFETTLVVTGGEARRDAVAALGLYGSRLRVGFGSLGGWDPFGPERRITRSRGNVLYELDGRSALELYKRYLGDQARDLPASGLLFPLSVREHGSETGVVRTILAVDEKEQSMTFAGDVPEGAYARLMKANFDRLIDGAVGAARISHQALRRSRQLGDSTVGADEHARPELGILISCVGRKMVLGQRIEEEVEGVRDVVGPDTPLTGFYSYGEISPFTPSARCELHNQTMTITTLSEC